MSPTPVSTVEDVRTALELVAARTPDRHVSIGDAEVVAFHGDLQRFHRDVLFRTAREYGGLRFPSAGELLELVLSTARTVAAEEAQQHLAGTLDTNACPGLCDKGWIETEGGSMGTLRPCERCNPAGHALWLHRSKPGHDEGTCGECISIRKGKPPQWLIDARAGVRAF